MSFTDDAMLIVRESDAVCASLWMVRDLITVRRDTEVTAVSSVVFGYVADRTDTVGSDRRAMRLCKI